MTFLPTIFVATILAFGTGDENLISNSGFESGTSNWQTQGPAEISVVEEPKFSGEKSLLVANRTEGWQGVRQDILGDLFRDKDYFVCCRIKLKEASEIPVTADIEIKQIDDQGTKYIRIAEYEVNSTEWTLIRGGFRLGYNGSLTELQIIINGSETHDFYLDEVSIVENDWLSEANDRINQFRKRRLDLNILDRDGNPLSGVNVKITQLDHEFGFGSALNIAVLDNENYQDFFRDNFEWGTIEWRLQWKAIENVRGVDEYDLADGQLEWMRENRKKTRGHALFWGDDRFVPDWADSVSDSDFREEMEDRISDVIARYSNSVVHWDVNNEMLRGEYYKNRFGPEIRKWMFDRADELAPKIEYFTNDYGIVESAHVAKLYKEQIQDLLDQGAKVESIGIQSHFFSQRVSPAALEIGLEELAGFDLPIWATEFDVSNPLANERAKDLETFYRYCFSRPELDGIIMWGFWANKHWRGENSALVDMDWTVNEAGLKYQELMAEWTTRQEFSETSEPALSVHGFHGNYMVEITDADNEKSLHYFRLNNGSTVALEKSLTHDPSRVGKLHISGTSQDDTFEYIQGENSVRINGELIEFPLEYDFDCVGFDGQGGNDSMELTGSPLRDHVFYLNDQLKMNSPNYQSSMRNFESITVDCVEGENVVSLFDSPLEDEIRLSATLARLKNSELELLIRSFERAKAVNITNSNDDIVRIIGSQEDDRVVLYSDFARMFNQGKVLESEKFQSTTMIAGEGGYDSFYGRDDLADDELYVSDDRLNVTRSDRTFRVVGFDYYRFNSKSGDDDVLIENETKTNLKVTETFINIRSELATYQLAQIKKSETIVNPEFFNRATIIDSVNDDVLTTNKTAALFSYNSISHRIVNFSILVANGYRGGVNQVADSDARDYALRLNGSWEQN